jgi:hypothetical protein
MRQYLQNIGSTTGPVITFWLMSTRICPLYKFCTANWVSTSMDIYFNEGIWNILTDLNLISTVSAVTKYFERGWKLIWGSFFNVEYWTLGTFSPLKIETKSCWKYTRGHSSTALQMHFFLILNDLDMLNIDPVEYWP